MPSLISQCAIAPPVVASVASLSPAVLVHVCSPSPDSAHTKQHETCSRSGTDRALKS